MGTKCACLEAVSQGPCHLDLAIVLPLTPLSQMFCKRWMDTQLVVQVEVDKNMFRVQI